MTSSRHRREVSRRTTVLGSLLALSFAGGVIALGLAEGNALRLTMMFILGVAVAAGLLALDEARVVEARVQAELSRERAGRARDSASHAAELRALVGRIDQLEDDLAGLRSEQRRAPRSIVIVAQGAHTSTQPAARILEIADVVPAVRAVFDTAETAPEGAAGRSVDTPLGPSTQAPELIDLRESVSAVANDDTTGDDEPIELDVDDFPISEVVGEFSLEGLALFPRPAGMPATFPSVAVEGGAEVPEPSQADGEVGTAEQAVIDLRDRQRTHRSA